jgi:hypothetical protein
LEVAEYKPHPDGTRSNRSPTVGIVYTMESLVRVAINNGPKVGWQIAKNIKVSPTLLELTSASLIETAFNWVTPLVGFGTILVEAAYLLVYRWYWKRDITGKQVAKRVFDSFCVVFSSVLGSIAMGTACKLEAVRPTLCP